MISKGISYALCLVYADDVLRESYKEEKEKKTNGNDESEKGFVHITSFLKWRM